MKTVNRMRKRAADLRATAEGFTIPSARRKLIEIAESLERLAAEREEWLRREGRYIDD